MRDLVGDEAVRAGGTRLVGKHGDWSALQVVEDGVDARRDLSGGRLVNRTLLRSGFDTGLVECVEASVRAKKVLGVRSGQVILRIDDRCIASDVRMIR